MTATPPLVTVTVFRFAGRRARLWAFAQMAFAPPLLRGVPGLRFAKLMGSGKGLGFTRAPDWGRYALLAVWDDRRTADAFLADSRFANRYRAQASALATIRLRPFASHGQWNCQTPFLPVTPAPESYHGPVAVLTRATIRLSRLRAFWGEVGPVSAVLANASGFIASLGVGELPFIRQATLSLWESQAAIRAFAYESPEHAAVIRRTRDEGWYREEMFARFVVEDAEEGFPLAQDQVAPATPRHP